MYASPESSLSFSDSFFLKVCNTEDMSYALPGKSFGSISLMNF